MIVYNPAWVQQSAGAVSQFVYLHECAHHALGQVVRGALGEVRPIPFANEQEADCAAIVYLVRTGEFGDHDVTLVQRQIFGSSGDWTHLPGPIRSTSLRRCLADAGVPTDAEPSPGRDTEYRELDPPTHTARFRIWSRAEGNAAALELSVDDEYIGSLSNLDRAETIEVEELTEGQHTFHLSDITAYGPYGPVGSGYTCSGTFRLRRSATFRIWARLMPTGEVRCGLQS